MPTTRDKITALALDFIRGRSYSSFSYDDVSRELGVTKAAVHYHFRNKEDLGLAVCESIREKILAEHDREMAEVAAGKHPWQVIEARIKSQNPRGICPIASLQADYENLPGRLRDALFELAKAEIDSLCALVRAYRPAVDTDAVVTLLLGLKGLLQYRRVMGDAFARKMAKSIKARFYELVSERYEHRDGRCSGQNLPEGETEWPSAMCAACHSARAAVGRKR